MQALLNLFHGAKVMDIVMIVVDILLVYYIIYRTLLLLKGTRALQMLIGLTLVIIGFFASKEDYLNLTTHWAQSRATDEQLEEVTDALLLAMHDLRSVLVRKKADRLLKD